MIVLFTACMFGRIQKLQDAQESRIQELERAQMELARKIQQLEETQADQEKQLALLSQPAPSTPDEPVPETENYTIPRDVWDDFWKAPEKLISECRFTVHQKDGKVDGYRVSGIRRTAFVYKFGWKNGDIIHAINGSPIRNLDEIMAARNLIDSSSTIQIDLTRRQKKRRIVYVIK